MRRLRRQPGAMGAGSVIFDYFHALHAACAASGSDACPFCRRAAEDLPATRCDVCGNLFNPTEIGFGGDKCMECNLRRMNCGEWDWNAGPARPGGRRRPPTSSSLRSQSH
jgi:hypothetical protein